MRPTRHVDLDPHPPLEVLTATARGMIDNNFIRAAQRAHTELMTAVAEAGGLSEVRTRVGLFPDTPLGPNDARCRYVAGVMFGHDLVLRQGVCQRLPIRLSGSLAWMPIPAGRHAVFTHIGPYHTLYRTWQVIYREWLPTSGELRRQVPAMELSLNSPDDVPAEELHTEIWVPLA
jgi:AraC family transcriptional regulator